EFLWDNRIAAVAGDNFALEPMPHNPALGSLHHRMLPLLGMPMGELFNFEELAADCVEDGVYECMLTSAPVHVYGGVASPPNALAIK
ncbi:MAG: cyclase family protein, partial [Dehalococcoidia bacterium]